MKNEIADFFEDSLCICGHFVPVKDKLTDFDGVYPL